MKKLISLLLMCTMLCAFAVAAPAETAETKNPNSGGVSLSPFDKDGDPSNGIQSGDLPEVVQKRMQKKGVELPVLRLLPLGFAVTVVCYDETNDEVISETAHSVWRGGEITVTAPTLAGYTLVPGQETSVTFTNVLENKVVMFNYTQDGPALYTLTVHYGNDLIPPDTYVVEADEFPFTVYPQPVPNYGASVGSYDFDFTGVDQEYTFNYHSFVSYHVFSYFYVYFVDAATGKSIAPSLYRAMDDGETWVISAKNIPGYMVQHPTIYNLMADYQDEVRIFYYDKDE